MSSTPRFTITFTVQDRMGEQQPVSHAIGCDEALRFSPRLVDEIKAPELSMMSFDQTVEIIKQRELRRDLFIEAAVQLANQIADRLEDAEGWHDESRKEPARAALGGRWHD